ncbi:MAG TPA: M20/M25/M40 family metallo-hydrolase [Vicinamibacterales bacterium]
MFPPTNRRSYSGVLTAAAACVFLVSPGMTLAAPLNGRVKHVMAVAVDPVAHTLVVTDRVQLAERPGDGVVDFVMNAALRITRSEPAVREVPMGADAMFFGINGSSDGTGRQVRTKRYRVTLAAGQATLSVSYEGAVDFGLSDKKEEYTRGFRETAGILGAEGIYLAGSSFWYPSFNRDLLEFDLDVTQPAGWHVISQGNGTSRDEQGHSRWDSGGAMDEIYLVGGPMQVWRDTAGAVETLVYLHERDDALAGKYLAATAQYLEMYRQLIGPYPYRKFALVENFWETGYGMPTFTLLGREIIRFPFIINSSYPHEILHNWWGNSVFVDYESGNWCEGLTAYLADHLIQEQRGTGDDYRRSTLQKYRDYVKEGRDFPLTAFRSRESASTEAVGYGKALMAYHMLRLSVGDDVFRKAIARFYRDFKGKRASFTDFETTIEAVSGRDFTRFFKDWIGRAGAPVLAVSVNAIRRDAGSGGSGFVVEGTIRQTQAGEPFAVDVPVVVQTPKGVVRQVVHLAMAAQVFSIATPDAPLMVHVDPRFDVFRKLDPRETPPSIGQIFGEPRVLAVLPSAASAAELQAWRELFKGWQSGSHAVEMKLDTEVAALPNDRAVWIAGRRNRWAARLFKSGSSMTLGESAIEVDGERMALAGHTLVLTARHPQNVDKAIGYLAVEPVDAFPGLGRKLPHYGKYSYLGFEGSEPVNVLKGQWQESDSPLRVDVRAEVARLDGAASAQSVALPRLVPLPADTRKALAELPPTFSQKALVDHVAYLADPDRQGRGPGSPGHDEAARYIADRFKAFGLAPAGSDGGYFQSFSMPVGERREARTVANVVGVIPGTRPEWKDQSVMVTAHYDHLGLGWPDVHKGDEGKVHPGADDNASGVAVMLELAHALAGAEKPSRTIVFVAFTGEEAGLLGSKYYVEHADRFPVRQIIGVINLDTVGRLGDQKLSVIGTGTASEWQHIFRGASFVIGVESRNIPEAMQASDQASFVQKGVPAVQIFTSAHADYHRPTDTVDRIDGPGLVKVATFVREGITYLAERAEPLTNTIAPPSPPAAASAGRPPSPPTAASAGQGAGTGRRVSFGTVPDFAFEGPGVRVGGLVAGSPAEKAGIKEGDVITAIEGQPIANLQAFSTALAGLRPGQAVRATVVRLGRDLTVTVTLVER